MPTASDATTPASATTSLADLLREAGVEPKAEKPETPVVPEATAETTPETATPEQPAEDPRLALLREAGLQDVTDFDDGLKRLTEAYKQRESTLADFQQKAEQAAREAEMLRAMQAQKPEPTQESKPTADKPFGLGTFKKPDATLLRKYLKTHTGEDGVEYQAWSADTPADFKANAERYAECMEALQSDPDEFFQKVLPAYTTSQEQVVQKAVAQHMEQVESQRLSTEFDAANPWLYINDPVTNKPAYDSTGMKVLSQRGRDFSDLFNAAPGSFKDKLEFAKRYMPPEAPKAAPVSADEKKKASQAAFLRDAVSRQSTDRGGSEPLNGHETQNRNYGFGNLLAESLGNVSRN